MKGKARGSFRLRRKRTYKLGDLSTRDALAAAARALAWDGEIILLLLNEMMVPWGFNFIERSLRARGYEHVMVATPTPAACTAIEQTWSALGAPAPACGWVSSLTYHPGWERWGINSTRSADTLAVLPLYLIRWEIARRLLDLRYNVLVLDLDAVLVADVYALLRSPPISQYDVIISDQGPKNGINCGFVYFNLRPTEHDRVERDRRKREAPQCAVGQVGPGPPDPTGAPCLSAAIWLAHAIFARILGFLELPKPVTVPFSARFYLPSTPPTSLLARAESAHDRLKRRVLG